MNYRHGWKPNRAGFFNYWHYDYDVFHFEDGKLHLKGANMSGKSITTQSLITILLDGKKDPSKLDTFGTKSRTLRDTFIGNLEENKDMQEKIGYVFLEYRRGHLPEYITTGMGLQTKSGSMDLDSWFFMILDNSRVGTRPQDIKLYKEEYIDGEYKKIPLTATELKAQVGPGVKIFTTNQEYMNAVNNHLFQFKDIQTYEHLMKLLIAMRSSKLGGGQKPKDVYRILTNSLPALSSEEMLSLSKTIDSMDAVEKELEEIQNAFDNVESLTGVYDSYTGVYTAEVADGFLKADNRLRNVMDKKQYNINELSLATGNIERLKGELDHLVSKERTLNERINSLRSKEAKDLSLEKGKLDNRIYENTRTVNSKRSLKEDKIDKRQESLRYVKNLQEQKMSFDKKLREEIKELDVSALESSFTQHAQNVGHFLSHYERYDYDFDGWQDDYDKYVSFIEEVKKKVEELEKLQSKWELQNEEKEKALSTLMTKQDEHNSLLRELNYEKKELNNKVDDWLEENEYLLFDEDSRDELSKKLYHFPQTVTERQVVEVIDRCYRDIKNQADDELYWLNLLQKEKTKQERQIHQELDEWFAGKMPSPFMSSEKQKVLDMLLERNIPHILFYNAVEFQDGVKGKEKIAIESALQEIGLLTTVVAPPEYEKFLSEYTTVPYRDGKKKEKNLTKYLKPNNKCGKLSVWVEEVLERIGISIKEDHYILSNGSIQNGMIKGQIELKEMPQFIGLDVQVQYKKHIMGSLSSQKDILNKEIAEIREEKSRIYSKMDGLKDELELFPSRSSVVELFNSAKGVEGSINEIYKPGVETIQASIVVLEKEIETIKRRVRAEADIGIPLSTEALNEVVFELNQYNRHLSTLTVIYGDLKSVHSLEEVRQENAETLLEDILNFEQEIESLQKEIKDLEHQADLIVKEMEKQGVLDNERQIQEYLRELKQLPEKKENFELNLREAAIKEATSRENISRFEKEQEVREKIKDAWMSFFESLIHLDPSENIRLKAEESLVHAHEYYSRKDNLANVRKAMEQELMSEYIRTKDELVEYSPILEKKAYSLESHIEIPTELEEYNIEKEWNDLRSMQQYKVKLDIQVNGLVQRREPRYVLDILKERIDIQRVNLTERDKRIYDQILFGGIGRSIKHKIKKANEFVSKMNRNMESIDTSGGLLFGIKWVPRKPLTEEELNTREIVRLLEIDPALLKDEDREALNAHFRSKIDKIKMEPDNQVAFDLKEAFSEVLDYRKWYEFQLVHKYVNQEKPFQVIDSTVFGKFSGGGRALALYIPILAAICSCYEEAGADSPRVISLDEAWAGVDESNINEMYKLLTELKLDFITNSEKLWSCYPALKAISIYELIRPKNSPVVNYAQYIWNGKNKEYITPKPLINEHLDDSANM
ncbi:TIGR02680 family protein [Mesobacillus foraminis]|uniref:TIGR02680 family protein n=1 Tax=Mesobacillus foraminis TaxID=279826 RepID=UPI001BEA87E3|nr:TIGR02680 family protein [Mesobacillus foraminis]MBT2759298.1 TIGR02680 family protein [Mesobacillus foraminis]